MAVAWGAVGVVLTIIGLGGLPDDLRGWASFLNALGHEGSRWFVFLLGLGLIAVAAIPRLRLWEEHGADSPPVEEERRPNWRIELEWMGNYGIGGLDGVRIRPHSLDGSTAKVYLCEVTSPDGEVAVANDLVAGSAIFGESTDRLTEESEREYLYPFPDVFTNAPKLPLREGTYLVRVFAQSSVGPGRELLASGAFRIEDGELRI